MDPDHQSVYTVVRLTIVLAYCRYRPRDNWEEPRHTPDALKTGATGENLAPVVRNQTGSAHCNTNNTPFSHIDGRGQNNPTEVHRDHQHREQTGAAPRGEQMDNNPNFPPRRQQHAHFKEGYNRRFSPPTFPSPAFNNTMAVMLLVDQSSNCRKSVSFIRFYFSRTAITDGCIQRDDTFQPGKGG